MPQFPHRERVTQVKVGTSHYTKKGISRFDLRDPYHVAVTLSWPQFLAALLSLYLVVNLVFATLYTLVSGAVANARPHNFADAFYFSFETLATVGYGEMYPQGTYGHIVACAEIVCGLAFTAILTGLTFVRFSRPRAKFIFAPHPVVALHDGVPTLMIRIANGRSVMLSEGHANLNVLLSRRTQEGTYFRGAQELHLLRPHIPLFPLSWTLMHRLDAASPLHQLDQAALMEMDARLFVSISAYDPSLSSTVRELRHYDPAEIMFGMRYADAVTFADDGSPVADLTRIGSMEPDLGAQAPRVETP